MHVDPCSWGFKPPGFQIAFPCIKNNKQKVKNYRRISLLPVSNKIFERLLCDSMFKFFTENNLISQNNQGLNQVTLVLTSSCQLRIKSTNLLMTVKKLDLCSWSSWISVWHKGVIFKSKQNGISGNVSSTLTDFLKLRKQWVVLNG